MEGRREDYGEGGDEIKHKQKKLSKQERRKIENNRRLIT
jgi:hypothetical protein